MAYKLDRSSVRALARDHRITRGAVRAQRRPTSHYRWVTDTATPPATVQPFAWLQMGGSYNHSANTNLTNEIDWTSSASLGYTSDAELLPVSLSGIDITTAGTYEIAYEFDIVSNNSTTITTRWRFGESGVGITADLIFSRKYWMEAAENFVVNVRNWVVIDDSGSSFYTYTVFYERSALENFTVRNGIFSIKRLSTEVLTDQL